MSAHIYSRLLNQLTSQIQEHTTMHLVISEYYWEEALPALRNMGFGGLGIRK